MKEYHNSSVRRGRSPGKTITTRVTARKSKQGRNRSVFNVPSHSYKGVFIAQRFTYSWAENPILPPNYQHLRIFRGQFGTVTSSDNLWIIAGPTSGPWLSSEPFRDWTPSIRASGGLRHSGPSLHPHLVIRRTSTFTVSSSSPCQIGTGHHPQIWSLRTRVIIALMLSIAVGRELVWCDTLGVCTIKLHLFPVLHVWNCLSKSLFKNFKDLCVIMNCSKVNFIVLFE